MHRSDQNPIITRNDIKSDIPELIDVSSVFNPGALRIDGRTHLLLRVQNRGRETYLIEARSPNRVDFDIVSEPTRVTGLEALGRTIHHIYDPRITNVDGTIVVTLAVDTDQGCRAVVAECDDLSELRFLGVMWSGEARNAVIFPERVNGSFMGLVRPNREAPGQPGSGSEIWLVSSQDLRRWTPVGPVLQGRPHYWDELIGSGPPPIKTRSGWLHIYHGIATHFQSVNIYQVGCCLLDLNDPTSVLARSRYNILEPREVYELTGQVPNVVFPTGLIVDDIDSDGFAQPDCAVTLYYGAADTVVAMATTTIAELLSECRAGDE